MKTKIKSVSILILYIFSFININTTLISEGYHFFDIFYYRDIYKNTIKQKKSNKCSIEDGPNCAFIKGKNKTEVSKELKNIYPEEETFFNETPENIYTKIKENTKLIATKDKEKEIDDDDIFSIDSPFLMSLYLTFESYDELTKLGDIYSPETIDTQYDVGRLTLTIIGKLRLSQKNAEKFINPTPRNIKDEGPKGTFAFVESKEVLIKFNSKSSVSSIYIKKNIYNKDNKTFYLYGYKDGHKHVITKLQNVPSNQWIKVTGDGKKYESIGLIRGFDFDNFIINTSINKEKASDINRYTKKYSSFLNEKINGVIQETLNQLKRGYTKTSTPTIKIVKIDLNQNDIAQEDQEDFEDFEIPEELMKEIDKNDNLDINNNDNNKDTKINEKKEEKNINKQDL